MSPSSNDSVARIGVMAQRSPRFAAYEDRTQRVIAVIVLTPTGRG